MAKKILLIDDDVDDRLLFYEAVHEISPNAICIIEKDIHSVLADLNNANDLPDIIFLDINMPRVNGWKCLELIKTCTAAVAMPVIMYATTSSPRDERRAVDKGAIGLLTKPDSFIELKRVLLEILSALDHKRPIDFSKLRTIGTDGDKLG